MNINTKQLRKAMLVVKKASNYSKGSLEIMGRIKLHADYDEQNLVITHDNLERRIEYKVPYAGPAMLDPCLVDLKKFHKAVAIAKKDSDVVTLRNPRIDGPLEVITENTSSEILVRGEVGDYFKELEFPGLEAPLHKLDADSFRLVLEQTVGHCAPDNGRKNLIGVNFAGGRAMASSEHTGVTVDEVPEIINGMIHRRAATSLGYALKKTCTTALKYFAPSEDNEYHIFYNNAFTIWARDMKVSFPEMGEVLPEREEEMEVDPQSLQAAVDCMYRQRKLLAGSNEIHLGYPEGRLVLSGSEGATFDIKLDTEGEGEMLSIPVNAALVKEVTDTLGTGPVFVEVHGPLAPITFRQGDVTALVMPLRYSECTRGE